MLIARSAEREIRRPVIHGQFVEWNTHLLKFVTHHCTWNMA